jgi:hypothetical protein
MKKNKNISNEYFESKMLLEYSKVSVYDMAAANVAETHVYDRTATLEERLALDRFYFDYNYKDYTAEDRAYIWNNNQRKFFKNINNQFIQLMEKANGCPIYDFNLNDLKHNDDIVSHIETHYKIAKKSNINLLITKVINEILGGMITSKKSKAGQHRGFEFTEEFTTNVKIMLTLELERAKRYIVPYVKSDLDQGIDMVIDENDEDERYQKLKEQYNKRYPITNPKA